MIGLLVLIDVLFTFAIRRTLIHRGTTAAAALAVLVAAATFAVLTASAAALADSGTRRALAAAPPTATGATFSAGLLGDVASADPPIARAARRLYAPYPVTVTRAETTGPVTLAGQSAVLVSAEGYASHVRLLAGALPRAQNDLLVPETVARLTGLEAGATIALETSPLGRNAVTENHVTEYHVAGVYQPADADPAFWGAAGQEHDPATGSLLPVTFAASPPVSAQAVWYVHPTLTGATPGGLEQVRSRILAVENGDVTRAVFRSAHPTVSGLSLLSGLPALTLSIQRAETAGLAGFLVIAALLAVLAFFALGLTLRQLRDRHADASTLTRARGAGAALLVGSAALDAFIACVPALVVVPLATGPALRLLVRLPALDALPIPDSPSLTALVVSLLTCCFCVVVQGVAAYAESREGTARLRGGRSARTAAFQRAGVDTGLAVVAVLGFLQLRHYRSPVAGGVDPVLVLAPALAAAALATLALRLLPWAAAVADRRLAGTRTFAGALGGWQAGRRAARHAGTVLLLVLALAVGAMTVTATALRSRSADDRAAFRLGADAEGEAATVPEEFQHGAYAAVPGVGAVTPVATLDLSVAAVAARVIGVEPQDLPAVARIRPDLLSSGGISGMVQPLAVPASASTALPGAPTRLRFTVTAAPGTPTNGTLTLSLRDRDGLPAAVTVPLPRDIGVPTTIEAPLTGGDGGGSGAGVDGSSSGSGGGIDGIPAYPLRLEGFVIAYPAPPSSSTATIALTGITTIGPGTGPVTLVGAPPRADGCPAASSSPASPSESPQLCAIARPGPSALTATFLSGHAPASSTGSNPDLSLTVPLTQASNTAPPVLPAAAGDAFLRQTDSAVGDQVIATIGGARVTLRITARYAAFPGQDPDSPTLLVDRAALSEQAAAAGSEPNWTVHWLLALRPGGEPEAKRYVADHPELGTVTFRRDLALAVRDGAFAGVANALSLIAAAAAPLFAAVGFTASTVVGLRARRREFAALRAIGVRPRQLAAALWIEQAVLAVVAVAVGLGIGVGTAAVTIPLVTVDDTGSPVFPRVTAVEPWLHATLVALGTAALVLVAVTAAARKLARVDLARTLRAGDEA